jgi:starch phosphorylase
VSQRAFVPRELPPGLEPLAALALDLRWTWSHAADHLWRAIDAPTWELTRNPWVILQETPEERLVALSRDEDFRRRVAEVVAARETSLRASPATGVAAALTRPVATFSLEYGVGEAIPLYAGGLGVLAGDLLKAASDLAVPMVAVGLLYQEGYFRQVIDGDGRQRALYPYNDPTTLPIEPVRGPGDAWITVELALPGRALRLRAWRATVGRVVLYLLDANVPTNEPADRGITGKLYGGGPELRFQQELVLGIGGCRLLHELGVTAGAYHLNEGHAAFAVLERARLERHAHGLTFAEAFAGTRGGNVFTTHTPLAAGFDAFPPALIARHLPEDGPYLSELGLSFAELLALGRAPGAADDDPFLPAYLAVRGSAHVNAVSGAHADTSRGIFGALFPRLPRAEVPVSHVTNGVHMPSWDSPFADELWTAACGAERWRGEVEGHEEAVCSVSDAEIWSTRARARAALVANVRGRLARQLARRGLPSDVCESARLVLDPDVLTLGFARRFAEYKRPNLLLDDVDRLLRLLEDPLRPIQLVIAGKAHPDDADGLALVEAWVRFASTERARARCVFLEDYDLRLAQELVQGVDVWLNTPRRPWEACGTSGMKALVNGGLNLSVRDGWWAEAYEPGLGWVVGDDGDGSDEADRRSLFARLEDEIVPTFYERDAEGLPRRWLALVRASLARLTPRYSANRMLREYVTGLYAPAERAVARRLADGGRGARALERWRRRLLDAWAGIHFGRVDVVEEAEARRFSVEVFLNDVGLADVAVELYADAGRGAPTPERVPMPTVGPLAGTTNGFVFQATLPRHRPASDYTPRIVPTSTEAFLPLELPLIAWRE